MSMESSDFGKRDYSDGRTKQSFKDQCDVNKMLKKAQRVGSIAHLMKHDKAIYGDFDGEFTLMEAQTQIRRAGEIFDELPSELKKEFNHDPLKFVKFAGDPENNEKLAELFPALAEPGTYFPNPVARGGQGAGAATAPAVTNDAAGASEATDSPPPSPSAEPSSDAGSASDT